MQGLGKEEKLAMQVILRAPVLLVCNAAICALLFPHLSFSLSRRSGAFCMLLACGSRAPTAAVFFVQIQNASLVLKVPTPTQVDGNK